MSMQRLLAMMLVLLGTLQTTALPAEAQSAPRGFGPTVRIGGSLPSEDAEAEALLRATRAALRDQARQALYAALADPSGDDAPALQTLQRVIDDPTTTAGFKTALQLQLAALHLFHDRPAEADQTLERARRLAGESRGLLRSLDLFEAGRALGNHEPQRARELLGCEQDLDAASSLICEPNLDLPPAPLLQREFMVAALLHRPLEDARDSSEAARRFILEPLTLARARANMSSTEPARALLQSAEVLGDAAARLRLHLAIADLAMLRPGLADTPDAHLESATELLERQQDGFAELRLLVINARQCLDHAPATACPTQARQLATLTDLPPELFPNIPWSSYCDAESGELAIPFCLHTEATGDTEERASAALTRAAIFVENFRPDDARQALTDLEDHIDTTTEQPLALLVARCLLNDEVRTTRTYDVCATTLGRLRAVPSHDPSQRPLVIRTLLAMAHATPPEPTSLTPTSLLTLAVDLATAGDQPLWGLASIAALDRADLYARRQPTPPDAPAYFAEVQSFADRARAEETLAPFDELPGPTSTSRTLTRWLDTLANLEHWPDLLDRSRRTYDEARRLDDTALGAHALLRRAQAHHALDQPRRACGALLAARALGAPTDLQELAERLRSELPRRCETPAIASPRTTEPRKATLQK